MELRKMAEFDVQKAIRMVVETGKVEFGTRTGASIAAHGGAKLMLLAGNCPKALKDDIVPLCAKSGVPLKELQFPSIEFGSICGKPFPVLMLSIMEEGDSDILTLIKEGNKDGKTE